MELSQDLPQDILRSFLLEKIQENGGSAKNKDLAFLARNAFWNQYPDLKYKHQSDCSWIARISNTCIIMARHGLLNRDKGKGNGNRKWYITPKGEAIIFANPLSIDQDIAQYTLTLEEEEPGLFSSDNPTESRERILRSIIVRRGQPQFRRKLIERYGVCLISGCNVIDALEAAHIQPYAKSGTNNLSNGLLLRGDIHTLFDLYLITINSSFVISISPDIYNSPYKCFDQKKIECLDLARQVIDTAALDSHYCSFSMKIHEL